MPLCRFSGWRKTAVIWQKSRFLPTWSRDRALGYESKKMRKVHLREDYVASKSQNSQLFSQKLHLNAFSHCHAKKMRKSFRTKNYHKKNFFQPILHFLFHKNFCIFNQKTGASKKPNFVSISPLLVLHVSINCSYSFCSFDWRFGCKSCWNVLKYYILVQ